MGTKGRGGLGGALEGHVGDRRGHGWPLDDVARRKGKVYLSSTRTHGATHPVTGFSFVSLMGILRAMDGIGGGAKVDGVCGGAFAHAWRSMASEAGSFLIC